MPEFEVFAVFALVRDANPAQKFGTCFPDTRELAPANGLMTLETGITTFDALVGGLGGSPNAAGAGGNVVTEDVVHMLTQKGIETGVDLRPLLDTSDLLERLVGHPLPRESTARCSPTRAQPRQEESGHAIRARTDRPPGATLRGCGLRLVLPRPGGGDRG
jgi:isopropylmalate/homocitrate/citramalate synthase